MKFSMKISKSKLKKWLKKHQKHTLQHQKYHDLDRNQANSERVQHRVSKIQFRKDDQVVQRLVEDNR